MAGTTMRQLVGRVVRVHDDLRGSDLMEQLTHPPVTNWAIDYDYFDGALGSDPNPTWAVLRERRPIAHTDRWGGSFMPNPHEDVRAIAHDTETFSSNKVSVADVPENPDGIRASPITSDPPEHTWARLIQLPLFAPEARRTRGSITPGTTAMRCSTESWPRGGPTRPWTTRSRSRST